MRPETDATLMILMWIAPGRRLYDAISGVCMGSTVERKGRGLWKGGGGGGVGGRGMSSVLK